MIPLRIVNVSMVSGLITQYWITIVGFSPGKDKFSLSQQLFIACSSYLGMRLYKTSSTHGGLSLRVVMFRS